MARYPITFSADILESNERKRPFIGMAEYKV